MNKCKICGKETKNNMYCSFKCRDIARHDRSWKKVKCKTCGKIYEVRNRSVSMFCSNECTSKDPDINAKRVATMKKTCLEKYGVESHTQTDKYKEEYKKRMNEQYGVDSYFQTDECKQKVKNTMNERYGVDYAQQSPEIKKKTKKVFKEKHGGYPMETEVFKNNMINKYGVDNPMKMDQCLDKARKTNLERYGVETPLADTDKQKKALFDKYGVINISQVSYVKEKALQTRYKTTYIDKFVNPGTLLKYVKPLFTIDEFNGICQYSNKLYDFECVICDTKFSSILTSGIDRPPRCPICYPPNQSIAETEVFEFIELNYGGEILRNDTKILNRFELDIYIPELNLAIEYNGLYYHSEAGCGKTREYHLNKTTECEKQGIRLIHIFEDEWIYKQDIVKSRIKQLLKINNSKRIHARKCEIREINAKVKNKFLNKFHIQGEDRSNIKLGAYCNNELVSIMTFSHGSISRKKYNSDIWELSRFCSNSNYRIPGIASKLLSYFKKNYNWKEIFSYADRRWSNGNVYKKIGFNLDSITKPNYWYIKNLNRVHRFSLRKKYEEPKEVPEWVLRQSEGYFRIWDCGHLKFKTIT